MFSKLIIFLVGYLVLSIGVSLVPDKRTPLERRLDRLENALRNKDIR